MIKTATEVRKSQTREVSDQVKKLLNGQEREILDHSRRGFTECPVPYALSERGTYAPEAQRSFYTHLISAGYKIMYTSPEGDRMSVLPNFIENIPEDSPKLEVSWK